MSFTVTYCFKILLKNININYLLKSMTYTEYNVTKQLLNLNF